MEDVDLPLPGDAGPLDLTVPNLVADAVLPVVIENERVYEVAAEIPPIAVDDGERFYEGLLRYLLLQGLMKK